MATPPASIHPLQQPTVQRGLTLRHLLNLPNILTLIRIFSIPFFLALLSQQRYTAALYLFGLAALTDGLDGAVARWFNMRTEIGAYLDPFADKLLLVSAFVVLTLEDSIPGWLLGVVLIRDIVIVSGYFLFAFFTGERPPMRPTVFGKASTFLQLLCVLGALARASQKWPMYWNGLLYLTLAMTALAGLHYAYQGFMWLSTREPEMFE
jgi:cardiolipin synthase (CMP-forming)